MNHTTLPGSNLEANVATVPLVSGDWQLDSIESKSSHLLCVTRSTFNSVLEQPRFKEEYHWTSEFKYIIQWLTLAFTWVAYLGKFSPTQVNIYISDWVRMSSPKTDTQRSQSSNLLNSHHKQTHSCSDEGTPVPQHPKPTSWWPPQVNWQSVLSFRSYPYALGEFRPY